MPFTVDVHHHIVPDAFKDAVDVAPQWSADGAVAFLDDAHIDFALGSISYPGVHLGNDQAARQLARICNECAAELKRSYPSRFGAFATLPLPDVEGALAELIYALDTLELDGVGLLSNFGGTYLGDQRFDPMFEELERRRAVVFVHPNASGDESARRLGLSPALLDFPMDTSRAIANLHYSNTFARTPDVTYVFSHAGGILPYLAGRLALFEGQSLVTADQARGSAAEMMRGVYWDTALAWSDPVLHLLRAVAGTDKVLFGTDYPYFAGDRAARCRPDLEASSELSVTEAAAVLGDNALRIFGRLPSPPDGRASSAS